MKSVKRNWQKLLAVVATVACVGCVVMFTTSFEFFLRTRHWSPVRIVEQLSGPAAVSGWSEHGLRLSDGRDVQLPNFSKLPVESPALSEATKRGVEVTSEGRVFGLISIHHTCGNDPVREHVVRIDLAHMLAYLGQGEFDMAQNERAQEYLAALRGPRLSNFGWEVTNFKTFDAWCWLMSLPKDNSKSQSPRSSQTGRRPGQP